MGRSLTNGDWRKTEEHGEDSVEEYPERSDRCDKQVMLSFRIHLRGVMEKDWEGNDWGQNMETWMPSWDDTSLHKLLQCAYGDSLG
jgi:hypothetical protein